MNPIILVINGQEDNRLTLKDRLKNDYEIIEAADGEDGLKLAERRLPDLILMELWLPRLDSREVTRRIKENPVLQNIPVIALTSFALAGDERKALEAGCNDYLAKPFDPVELLAKIHRYLS